MGPWARASCPQDVEGTPGWAGSEVAVIVNTDACDHSCASFAFWETEKDASRRYVTAMRSACPAWPGSASPTSCCTARQKRTCLSWPRSGPCTKLRGTHGPRPHGWCDNSPPKNTRFPIKARDSAPWIKNECRINCTHHLPTWERPLSQRSLEVDAVEGSIHRVPFLGHSLLQGILFLRLRRAQDNTAEPQKNPQWNRRKIHKSHVQSKRCKALYNSNNIVQ